MNNMTSENKSHLGMVTIGGIVVLMSIALIMGHDGVLLTGAIGAIGAIAGGIIGFSWGVGKIV